MVLAVSLIPKFKKLWKLSLIFISLGLKLIWWQNLTWTDLRIFIILILLRVPIHMFVTGILVYLITGYLITLLEMLRNYMVDVQYMKNPQNSEFQTLLDSRFLDKELLVRLHINFRQYIDNKNTLKLAYKIHYVILL